jgi:hypothetical protein
MICMYTRKRYVHKSDTHIESAPESGLEVVGFGLEFLGNAVVLARDGSLRPTRHQHHEYHSLTLTLSHSLSHSLTHSLSLSLSLSLTVDRLMRASQCLRATGPCIPAALVVSHSRANSFLGLFRDTPSYFGVA